MNKTKFTNANVTFTGNEGYEFNSGDIKYLQVLSYTIQQQCAGRRSEMPRPRQFFTVAFLNKFPSS